jgi:hypothetical protein
VRGRDSSLGRIAHRSVPAALAKSDNQPVARPDSPPALQAGCAKTLDLTVDEVTEGKAASDEIRKILASLNQVVVGLAELRNQYGTGHGRHRKSSGLSARHASSRSAPH